MILVIILYALCASSFTIAKAILSYSSPIFFFAVRALLAGSVLWTYARIQGISLKIKSQDRAMVALMALVGTYVTYVLDLWSLQYMSSFKSAFFFNLSPFITALLSYIFFHERLKIIQWFGLILGFVSVVPLIMQHAPCENIAGELFSVSVPEAGLLLAVFASCVGWILMKRLLSKQYHFVALNGISMMGAGCLALLTSAITEHWIQCSPVSDIRMFIGLTIAIIIVCNIAFSNLYGFLLHRYSPTFLSFAGFMCPLFAALFGVVFLKEEVTWHFIVGSLGVFLGLYLFYKQD